MSIKDIQDIGCGGLSDLFVRKSIWIGETPPIIADTFDVRSGINYRAPARLHGMYEVVWIYEWELFSIGSAWPLILDEAIRLLGPFGYLVIRTTESSLGTIFELKSALARNPDLDVDLISQEQLNSGDIVSVYSLSRLEYGAYLSCDWTIGVLSNGTKNSNVEALISKLYRLAGSRKIEFLIAGPEFVTNAGFSGKVRFLATSGLDDLPRISKKKSLIVENAAHDNVAIFHDRYQVNDDFFSGFDEYGYDFDFVSILQYYESGKFYPSYVGFKKRSLRWQTPVFDQTFSQLHDGHFVNGGLIILKRHTGRRINFNPMLLHNEAEDVELAAMLRVQGIPPRMNPHSSAVTIGIPDTYTATFIDVSGSSDWTESDMAAHVEIYSPWVRTLWSISPRILKNYLRKTHLYEIAKKRLLFNR